MITYILIQSIQYNTSYTNLKKRVDMCRAQLRLRLKHNLFDP